MLLITWGLANPGALLICDSCYGSLEVTASAESAAEVPKAKTRPVTQPVEPAERHAAKPKSKSADTRSKPREDHSHETRILLTLGTAVMVFVLIVLGAVGTATWVVVHEVRHAQEVAALKKQRTEKRVAANRRRSKASRSRTSSEKRVSTATWAGTEPTGQAGRSPAGKS